MKFARRPQFVVSTVFVAAMFLNIMDSTVVNVALPVLSRDFAVPISSVSGVVTAYLVALAVAMPASGWVGDRFGARITLIISIGLFTIASALCGVATSLPELVAFRAVQGIGGGALIPVGQAMITRAFPQAERIRMNRILIVPTLMAPALGPVIGGLLVDGPSWRWIFYINLPIGAVALIVTTIVLRLPKPLGRPRIDYPGMILLGGAVISLVLLTSWGGTTYAWTSPVIIGLGAGALAFGAAWLVSARYAADPVIPLRLFRDPAFRIACAISLITGIAMFGAISYLPTYLQIVTGVSATGSGLLLLPLIAGLLVTSISSGRLITRTGHYKAYPARWTTRPPTWSPASTWTASSTCWASGWAWPRDRGSGRACSPSSATAASRTSCSSAATDSTACPTRLRRPGARRKCRPALSTSSGHQ
jgi:EmrB/QacA subfamily drug resistance transporter